MVMEGKDNPYDPAELFKQWLENTSKVQSDFAKNMNPFQTNTQNPFNLQNMMPNFLSWSAFKTTVGSNGRISIPEAERQALSMDEGDLVQVVVIPVNPKNN
jgi:hypothetical protein